MQATSSSAGCAEAHALRSAANPTGCLHGDLTFRVRSRCRHPTYVLSAPLHLVRLFLVSTTGVPKPGHWAETVQDPILPELLTASRHTSRGVSSFSPFALSWKPARLEKCSATFSWNARAWCRTERVLRELAPNDPWIIMIKSSTELELTSSFAPFFVVQPAGEGHFTDEKDRRKLAPVFQHALLCKMKLLLKRLDVVGYRFLLNKQNVYLRGFDVSAVYDLVPGFAPDPGLGTDTAAFAAQEFLFQNGLT